APRTEDGRRRTEKRPSDFRPPPSLFRPSVSRWGRAKETRVGGNSRCADAAHLVNFGFLLYCARKTAAAHTLFLPFTPARFQGLSVGSGKGILPFSVGVGGGSGSAGSGAGGSAPGPRTTPGGGLSSTTRRMTRKPKSLCGTARNGLRTWSQCASSFASG